MQLHGDTPVARNESAALLLVAGKGGIRADFCLFWTMPTMKVKYAYRIGGAAMRAILFTIVLAMLSGTHAGEVDADELMQWQEIRKNKDRIAREIEERVKKIVPHPTRFDLSLVHRNFYTDIMRDSYRDEMIR